MDDLIHLLISMQTRYRVLHWYAPNYNVHLAVDKFNKSSQDVFDELIETAKAMNGPSDVDQFVLELSTFRGVSVAEVLEAVRADVSLVSELPERTSTILASQLDQLGGYLTVLANNLGMIAKD